MKYCYKSQINHNKRKILWWYVNMFFPFISHFFFINFGSKLSVIIYGMKFFKMSTATFLTIKSMNTKRKQTIFPCILSFWYISFWIFHESFHQIQPFYFTSTIKFSFSCIFFYWFTTNRFGKSFCLLISEELLNNVLKWDPLKMCMNFAETYSKWISCKNSKM